MRIKSVAFAFVVAGCVPPPSAVQPSAPREPEVGELRVSPHMLVTTDRACPRGHDCDIVEVVDLHTKATSEDKGFDELRARAAAENADAVIGAEFEHGDGDEPSHLSGVVVRWGNPVPPHVDIAEIDVPSDPINQDKGLHELSARGHAMGGDQVIDVTFEHGDDGARGHLHGKVIRFTR